MKHRVVSRVTLGALLLALGACMDSSSPLQPTLASVEPSSPSTANRLRLQGIEEQTGGHDRCRGVEFLPISPSGVTYDRVTSSFIPGSSRYVIHGDGTFSLQYVRPDWGFFEYKGHYSRANSTIKFKFDAWSVSGPWVADGVLCGDALTVKYNDIMLWDDFEDGLFVRTAE